MSAPVTSIATVAGMTCGHCVAAVREEVAGLEGVETVDVQLDGGRVTIVSDGPITDDAVRGAVEEAGYELVAFEQPATS